MNIVKCISFITMVFLSASVSATDRKLSVVPYPRHVEIKKGAFDFASAKVLYDSMPEKDRKVIAGFSNRLAMSSSQERKTSEIIFIRDSTIAFEAYTIDIGRKKTEVRTGSYQGTFYAVQTLMQLCPPEIYTGAPCSEEDWMVPCSRIEDAPRFSYRGAHLDCSRHFFPIAEVKKFLDVISMYKINRFHWHLTDDHGWRIEIRKYPLLTETGAWRNGTQIGWAFDSNDGKRYGGYYTQKELREVVSYADSLGIEIVPEIDLPAHMVSALTAYPYLGCTGGPYELMTKWDISKDVLCAGKETSFEFIEDVFDEVCDIFPCRYIHIGGDECPKVRWENCPYCQARIRELGLEDTDRWSAEHYLQNYVTARVQKYLAGKGRNVIGWDEILEGDLSEGATIMSWRGTEGGIKAAESGFDVIMTPLDYCYLDYCQSDKPELEPISIGHYLPVEKCYEYEPLDGVPAENQKHILGLQGNVWTEFISTASHVQYMLLPRIIALSEVQWCLPEHKNYGNFRDEIITHQFPILKSMGYSYCKEILD